MKTLLVTLALMIGIGASAQTNSNCCINPDWIAPMAMCTMEYDPVIGCDGVEYGNYCAAEASGVTSWTDQSGIVESLYWDCDSPEEENIDSCCINPEWVTPNAACFSLWDPVVGCDGETYSNSCVAQISGLTSWTNQSGVLSTIDWNCEMGGPLCTSSSGIEIFEAGAWVNPNDACDMGQCTPDGTFFSVAIDCANWFGAPCAGEWVSVAGECCPICEESNVLCTSSSGVELFESGSWENPNDPCEFGICNDDGTFDMAIVDCPEHIGLPCEGEWVLEDGNCCSTCIEAPDSDCGNIYITLNNGWNMIGFACAQNKDAGAAFSAIQDKIIIAKDGAGNAYLPDWNFNGINDLERGYGYMIKVAEAIANYSICE